jgi:hypothetical protein
MRKALAVLIAVGLAGCGGGGDDSGPTGTGGQTPTLALSVSPATLSVQQSGSGTVAITITRGGGLTANVDLSVEGAPTGVTGAFSPASLANGVTSSTLTLSASSTAAAGTSTVTVRAKSSGVSDQTATVALTVTAASSAGGFTITTAPATVVQGATATSNVTIARTGAFSGAVALTVSGAPTGLTATLNPTSVTGTSSTLTLNAAATTATGSYTLTVSGTGTGVANQSATVGVTVQAASTSTGNIAWTYCSNALPLWFAVQDGSGAWTRVTPDVNNTFKFNINSATGGVAVVTQGTSAFTTNVTYGTAAELTSQAATCAGGVQKTLTGTFAGLASGDLAAVAMGGAVATVTSPTTGFTLNNVAGGTQDLLAVQSSQTISGASIAIVAKKGIIRRSLNLANNAVIPVLDFNAAEAFTPASATVTLANGGSDFVTMSLGYFTSNGSSGSFTTGFPSSSATQTYYGVPAANQATGDFHALIGAAATISGTSVTQVRTATKFFKTVANQTLTFGAAPGATTVTTAATSPVARLRAQWTVQSDYNKLFTVGYTQSVASVARQVNVTATAAALGGNPTAIDLMIPDLSGVTGFDTNWGLKTGTAVTWLSNSSGWSFAAGAFGTSPVEGGVILTGSKLGTITP